MLVDTIKALCDNRGLSLAALERTLHFGNGTIRKWDAGEEKHDK